MARPDISMSPAEIDRFVATQPSGAVVALKAAGAPVGAAARIHLDDGRLGFSVRLDDSILAQLAEDDRVCCTVEQFPAYHEIKGVMFHGRAIRRPDAAPGLARFDLTVERVVSFDFGKLPRGG